ncbi:lysosomal enzyme trafficking factor [Genypterus blacodes]|uniref:lysosomal enzyme trafficking factor n=1 Tax=Genypterus blacodes TaxID=154954 RepID=UPI003F75C945
MMNFRQRMGWLGVAFFLLLSILAVYCMFELQQFSLEHIQGEPAGHLATPTMVSWRVRIRAGLPPLPIWLWASAVLLPYLQLFLFLFSCTRADPRAVGYCILPICLALLCSRRHAFSKSANQISHLELIET